VAVFLFGACLVVALALFLAPGTALLAVIPLGVAALAGLWLVLSLIGGVAPTQAVRKTRKHEFFGPGGPDDPDRSR
jgi:hypothetical protein